MLFKNQKIRIIIDNKRVKLRINRIDDGIFCINSEGQEFQIDLNNCLFGNNSNTQVPLFIKGKSVGIIHDNVIIYSTNEAIDRAVSNKIINNKDSFINFIYKVLNTSEKFELNEHQRVLNFIKYKKHSTRMINIEHNCMIVLVDNLIVDVCKAPIQ